PGVLQDLVREPGVAVDRGVGAEAERLALALKLSEFAPLLRLADSPLREALGLILVALDGITSVGGRRAGTTEILRRTVAEAKLAMARPAAYSGSSGASPLNSFERGLQ